MNIKNKIKRIIRESLEDEEIPGFGKDYNDNKIEKKVAIEKEIKKVLNKWYKMGKATWSYRGAPGRDGIWGGTFHYMGDLNVVSENKEYVFYKVYVDMGSVSEEREAVLALKNMLKEIGAELYKYSGPRDSIFFFIKAHK